MINRKLPKLALYQAELRPEARKLADSLEKASPAGRSDSVHKGPKTDVASRSGPAVSALLTRERLAELATILERRIAERTVAPATLDVLARAGRLLRGRPGR